MPKRCVWKDIKQALKHKAIVWYLLRLAERTAISAVKSIPLLTNFNVYLEISFRTAVRNGLKSPSAPQARTKSLFVNYNLRLVIENV